MIKGIDYTGISVCFYCHDGHGNYVFHRRGDACRDEQGTWDSGGGGVQFGESIEDAVKREIKEEYGVDALVIEPLGYYDAVRELNGVRTHWLIIKHRVLVPRQFVRINEPDKQTELGWFTIDKLPSPLHSLIPMEIERWKDKL